MNQGLEHEEILEMLPAAALEILEDDELQGVLAHARGCAECGRLLGEYRQVVAGLSLQLPEGRRLPPDRSAGLRGRLLAKARGDRRAVLPNPHRATTLISQWSGWMVAAGLASVLLVHHSVHRPLDYGWLATGALLAILIAVGIYAHVQRARAAALHARVADLERRKPAG